MIVLELQYLPDIGYLTKLANRGEVLLENCESFVKSSSRNRTQIATANGRQMLSIPIQGGRSHHQRYRDAQIDYRQSWQRLHLNSIQTAYGKSPFYEYYRDELNAHFAKKPAFLWDWNYTLMQWICDKYKFSTRFVLTESYEKNYPAGVDYRDQHKTLSTGNQTPYHQCFSSKTGFLSGLSGIDLLFNLGPSEGRQYLKSFQQHIL
jgi:hypothetical protein